MPMGIVNDKDFEKEKANVVRPTPTPKPVVKMPEIIEPPSAGRSEGDINVPNSLRNLIGMENTESGRSSALELAAQFGISPSSVSAYGKGATSTATMNDRPNKPIINTAKLRVQKKAQGKMMLALNHLTEEKIAECKARDIAGIAKDMAAIVKAMEPEPEQAEAAKQQPQFVVFAPQFRDERQYETVYVKE